MDLEHHDAYSYVGLVSLMQISTREKDWIVDTLLPWREDLQILNEVFTDPRIVKVCSQAFVIGRALTVWHRSFMDRIWTWYGYKETSVSMSSAYLIPSMLLGFWATHAKD